MTGFRHRVDLRAGMIGAACAALGCGAAVAVIAGCGGSDRIPDPDGSGPGMTGSGSDAPGPLDPPGDVRAEAAPVWSHCLLTWSAPPQPVDGYLITASAGWTFPDGETHDGIAPGTATQVELNFSIAARELDPIEVRIRSRNRGRLSLPAPAVSCVPSVVPPQEVTVIPESSGIAVSWLDVSSVATTIEIERATLDAGGAPGAWTSIATLPAQRESGTTRLDPDVVAGSAYGYRISAVAPGGQRGTSEVATSLTLGAPLETSTVVLPPSVTAVIDRAGHHAFSSAGYGFGRAPSSAIPLQITWGTGAPWATSPAITAVPYAPFVRLDAAGLPHTVYGKPMPQQPGLVMITHAWSDGTQWLEESIAQRTLEAANTPALVFDLDASGMPVMMWQLATGPFEAATKIAGTWTVKPLDDLIPSGQFGTYTVFGDESGATHLIVPTIQGLAHIQLSGGSWTTEIAVRFGFYSAGQMLGVGRDVDHLAICFDATRFPVHQPACLRKTPTGWGSIEPLGALPGEPGFDQSIAWIAMSADGKRLAVLYQNHAAQLFRSDDGGAWTELALPALTLPMEAVLVPSRLLGFDASGKLFVLVDPTARLDAEATEAEYQRSREP